MNGDRLAEAEQDEEEEEEGKSLRTVDGVGQNGGMRCKVGQRRQEREEALAFINSRERRISFNFFLFPDFLLWISPISCASRLILLPSSCCPHRCRVFPSFSFPFGSEISPVDEALIIVGVRSSVVRFILFRSTFFVFRPRGLFSLCVRCVSLFVCLPL